MNLPGPGKAERVVGIGLCLVICVAGVVASVAFAIHRSLIGTVVALSAAALLLFSILRSRGVSEDEMIRRQDAIGKTKDDPNEMARWVP
jgi:uncharacterized membrane protein